MEKNIGGMNISELIDYAVYELGMDVNDIDFRSDEEWNAQADKVRTKIISEIASR